MAIRKNKKRFDPRYFMDEKMEEPLNESNRIGIQKDDSGARAEYIQSKAEEEERKAEEERRRRGRIDNNVGRHTTADHSVNHSLEEGDLSHLADPAVWEALGLAAAKMASIWVPLLGIGGLGIIIKDAIEYLKNTPESSHEDALQHAVQRAESGSKEELEEVNQTTQWVDIERGKAQPPGAYDAGAKRLVTLVDPRMVNALKTIREYWPNLGDVKRLEAYAKSELADEESKNAISILSSLGKHVNEWCPECVHKRATSELPSDAQDAPMPGNLEERRRRLRKKRSK